VKRVVEDVVVTDPLGVHARPAAALAVAVGRSGARVTVALGAKKTSAASVVGLLSLGAAHNSTITAEIEGEDEAVATAIAALHTYLRPQSQT
jgi:phosphotransferase system HPr (HPr) family protein